MTTYGKMVGYTYTASETEMSWFRPNYHEMRKLPVGHAKSAYIRDTTGIAIHLLPEEPAIPVVEGCTAGPEDV